MHEEETIDLNNLTEEQLAKARECKSAEELIKLSKEEGVELSDEQIAAVAGGVATGPCPSVAGGEWNG